MDRARAVLPVLQARDDDVDDVRWALQTAQARWQSGGQADAVVWLQRAAEAAEEAGDARRATELREDADELAEQVVQRAVSSPPPSSSNGAAESSVQPTAAEPSELEIDVDLQDVEPAEPEELDSSVVNSLDAEELDSDVVHALDDEELEAAELIDEEELLEPLEEPLDRESATDSMLRSLQRPSTELGPPPAPGTPGSPEPASPSSFSEPEQQRQSLGEMESQARPAFASAPELEVEELGSDNLLGLVTEQEAEPASSSPGHFNDRLSSADVEPLNAEAAIAELDANPDSLEFDLERAAVDLQEASQAAETPIPQSAPELETPVPEPSTPAAEPEVEPEVDPIVDGVTLTEARGFEDLPVDVQRRLAQSARIEQLNRGDEVGFFGAALITRGAVDILPAFADDPGAQARHGDVVFTRGTLEESIELRVEAKIDETHVAVWQPDEIEQVLQAAPWVADELRFIADYYLAVCGATLGPMGERLDNSLRATIFGRMEVRPLEPGQLIASAGHALDGLYVIGGGRVEVVEGSNIKDQLSPGDFLFPATMLSGEAAPYDARAGSSGALVLCAPRTVARELMMSVPPLLEVLAY